MSQLSWTQNVWRIPIRFAGDLLRQPTWVPIWVFALMIVNMASLAFWSELLAKVIFVTFLMSAMLMMALYAKFGFERILGFGHVFWIPLLAYILVQVRHAQGEFHAYLVVLSLCIGASLLFDILDVWTFLTSKRVAPPKAIT